MSKAATVIDYAYAHCDLGYLLLACKQQGVCAVFLADQTEQLKAALQQAFPQAILNLQQVQQKKRLDSLLQFIEDPRTPLALTLAIEGTDFQRAVWQQLQAIPFGQTADYVSIAARLGRPKAYRAVASACAANKLAVIIPCHRVIRKNGDPSDYRWGLWRKQALLAREQKLLAK